MRELESVLSFLTILPLKSYELQEVSKNAFLFPLVGGMIGILSGIVALLLRNFLSYTVSGALTFGFILLFTGLHHTDGLLDFGDGLMIQGNKNAKLKAMHDKRLGVGGFVLGFLVLLTTFLCISEVLKLEDGFIILALISSEALAKFSMNTLSFFGKSASKGIGSYFLEEMNLKRYIFSLIFTLSISSTLKIFGIFLVIFTISFCFFLNWLSNRNFGGVTGDVLGASNEVLRMLVLLIILGKEAIF
ncbi:MAG: adenosylcobinamide-GDP ribazoletransferase [Candidatus Methanofastidiosia archaeon]